MKNTLKKVLSLFTAILMTITLGTTSIHAEGTESNGFDPTKSVGTLSITSNQNGKTGSQYSVYQVLETLEVPEGQNVYEYQFTQEFKEFTEFKVEDIAALKSGSKNYTYDAETVDKVATALKAYIDKKSVDGNAITPKATLSNTNLSANLNLGYYLILETTPTEGYTVIKPMLVAIPSQENGKYNYEVIVELKDQPLSTTKQIVDGDKVKDSIAQQVGKEYTYRITQDIPKYGATYDENSIVFKLTDTLSKGLDFVDVTSVKADKAELTENTDYELTKTENQDGTTTLTFDFSNREGKTFYTNIKGANELVIEYTVKLNKDASFGLTGNPNEVVPEFTHTPGDTTKGDKEITATYAGLLEIQKVGEDGKTGLEGAEFTVYSDEACTKEATLVTYEIDENGAITQVKNPELSATATTDKDGIARFEGLGAGTYYIKETGSPSGYIELDKPIKVIVTVTPPETITTGTETATFNYTVNGNGVVVDSVQINNQTGKLTFTVKNTKGFTLPTTGGIGTYVFTIGGAVLILAAVVLFVRSRKETK